MIPGFSVSLPSRLFCFLCKKVDMLLFFPFSFLLLFFPGADSSALSKRLVPFMVYARLSSNPDSNHYSFPLPLQPVIDTDDNSLFAITWTPIFGGDSTETVAALPSGTFPWEKLEPEAHEYNMKLRVENGYKMRDDLKPLIVAQPDGPSFKVEGRVVSWQKVSSSRSFARELETDDVTLVEAPRRIQLQGRSRYF